MFDIGFSELLLTAVIALVVIGPQRLPETIRTVGLWVGRAKRALNRAYKEMDRELGLDDIRRQLHNEEVMRSLEEHKKRLEEEILGRSKVETGKPDSDEAENTQAQISAAAPSAIKPSTPESSVTEAPALEPSATSTAVPPSEADTGDGDHRKDNRHE